MSADSNNKRPRYWGRLLAVAIKRTGLSLAVIAGAGLVAGFVLWDADFYVVRDRWEHFKIAMFGEWQPKPTTTVQDIFDTIDTISLFQKATVADVGVFITGANFTSGDQVEENLATEKWCYVNVGGGAVVERVTLGEQTGTDTPQYTDIKTISSDVLAGLGVSATRLADLSRLHCRFSDFRER